MHISSVTRTSSVWGNCIVSPSKSWVTPHLTASQEVWSVLGGDEKVGDSASVCLLSSQHIICVILLELIMVAVKDLPLRGYGFKKTFELAHLGSNVLCLLFSTVLGIGWWRLKGVEGFWVALRSEDPPSV